VWGGKDTRGEEKKTKDLPIIGGEKQRWGITFRSGEKRRVSNEERRLLGGALAMYQNSPKG